MYEIVDCSAAKHTVVTFETPSISLSCLQDDVSEEHKNGTVDGFKAGEILRSLATLGNTDCVKAGMEAIEADADAVVRMLTGGSGVSSGGRVGHGWRQQQLTSWFRPCLGCCSFELWLLP